MKKIDEEYRGMYSFLLRVYEKFPNDVKPIVNLWLQNQYNYYSDRKNWIELDNKTYNQKYEEFRNGKVKELVDLISKKTNKKLDEYKYNLHDLVFAIVAWYMDDVHMPGTAIDEYLKRSPFSTAAAREIEIVKNLNSDGTYNTTYRNKSSNIIYVVDSKGKVVSKGAGPFDHRFEHEAQKLWKMGINADFIHEHYDEEKGCTVGKYYIKSWTDNPATKYFLEAIKEENEKQK